MSGQYYRTCPDCGCNLDPGEICDCKKEPTPEPGSYNFDRATPIEKSIPDMYPPLYNTGDALIIGYDRSKGLDIACLTVARKTGDHILVLKEFIGMEAIKQYENLTMGPCVKYDPHMEEFLKKELHISKN